MTFRRTVSGVQPPGQVERLGTPRPPSRVRRRPNLRGDPVAQDSPSTVQSDQFSGLLVWPSPHGARLASAAVDAHGVRDADVSG